MQHVVARSHGAGLLVVGTYDYGINSSIQDGPRAHDAGLEGDEHGATVESPVAECRRRVSQSHNLGVGRRVIIYFSPVLSRSDDDAVFDYDATDGNVVVVGRSLGEFEGLVHELVHRRSCHRPPLVLGGSGGI